MDYKTAHDVSSVSLRYFNAAGADPELEIGEDRGVNETHIIPLAIKAARHNKTFKLFSISTFPPICAIKLKNSIVSIIFFIINCFPV